MNIQGFLKMTLLDYPGRVACTVFTGGCNLRCPFCHNSALVLEPNAEDNLQEEVISYLLKRKKLLDGVCISGGEPLLQPGLEDFIREVKKMGYLVKLDTNGSFPERLESLLGERIIDCVAMDIKAAGANYSRLTGSDIEYAVFEKSINIIKASGLEHEFRTTLVKGLHSEEDVEQIARTVGAGHKLFLQKFKDSGSILSGSWQAFDREESQKLLLKARKFAPLAELRG